MTPSRRLGVAPGQARPSGSATAEASLKAIEVRIEAQLARFQFKAVTGDL